MRRTRMSLALASALALALGTQAAAQSPAGSPAVDGDCEGGYPTRDITLVVPYSPGGGFDTWARLIAPFLTRHLPNQVNVLVENRSGAGGLVGVTEVYGAAADGSTIVITEPGILVTSAIAGTTIIDPAQLRAIGRVAVSPEAIVVAAGAPWQDIAAVQEHAATTGFVRMANGGIAAVNVVSFDALGLNWEGVFHEGSSESILSLIRGDTDISIFTYTSLLDNIKAGDVRMLVLVGTQPTSPEQPGFEEAQGVPTLDEVTGQEGLGAALEQHRIIAAPPGTPDCVVDILSDALMASLTDPELVAQARAADLLPVPVDAAGTQAIIENTVTTLNEYADLIREKLSE
ncbi:MAG: tripartite tricarboxylate transporter substrate binding protein [Chloroflexi bacterium]|nr:tripartite tricarboxylate transporter substrate binding protein [Chloroflexota bacterium]